MSIGLFFECKNEVRAENRSTSVSKVMITEAVLLVLVSILQVFGHHFHRGFAPLNKSFPLYAIRIWQAAFSVSIVLHILNRRRDKNSKTKGAECGINIAKTGGDEGGINIAEIEVSDTKNEYIKIEKKVLDIKCNLSALNIILSGLSGETKKDNKRLYDLVCKKLLALRDKITAIEKVKNESSCCEDISKSKALLCRVNKFIQKLEVVKRKIPA